MNTQLLRTHLLKQESVAESHKQIFDLKDGRCYVFPFDPLFREGVPFFWTAIQNLISAIHCLAKLVPREMSETLPIITPSDYHVVITERMTRGENRVRIIPYRNITELSLSGNYFCIHYADGRSDESWNAKEAIPGLEQFIEKWKKYLSHSPVLPLGVQAPLKSIAECLKSLVEGLVPTVENRVVAVEETHPLGS